MDKKLKKLTSALLVAVMLVTNVGTVFATDTADESVESPPKHLLTVETEGKGSVEVNGESVVRTETENAYMVSAGDYITVETNAPEGSAYNGMTFNDKEVTKMFTMPEQDSVLKVSFVAADRVYDEEKGIYVDEYEKENRTLKAKTRMAVNENPNPVFGNISASEVVNAFASYLSVPYVFGGATPSGWDCSGYLSYISREHLGVDMGRTTINIDAYCMNTGALAATGSSAEEFNSDYENGIIKPGDIVMFYNVAGNSVHCAVVGNSYSIYHAWGAGASDYWFKPPFSSWCEGKDTVHCRFDSVWAVDGGHGKVYSYYNIYRGVQEDGSVEIYKSSSNPELTNNNPAYSLEGAKYGVWLSGHGDEEPAAVLVTDANGYAKADGLPAGDYWLKEIEAPKGYAKDPSSHYALIQGGQTATVYVTDHPQDDPVAILLGKVDRETNQNKPQGSASLEGAEFTVKYYAGSYTADPAQSGIVPERTWVFATDKDGFARLAEDYYVSGDELYTRPDGTATFPLGTITIQETKAPTGYLVNPEIYVRQITPGMSEGVETYNMPTVPETPQKGVIQLHKVDAETGLGQGQGTATLKDSQYQIKNSNGDVVETLTTDANGRADSKALPWGTYTIQEVKAPEGYLVNPEVQTVNISTNDNSAAIFYKTVTSKETPQKGVIKLQKKSTESDNGSTSLKDAVYEVRNSNNALVETLTTDADGKAQTKKLPFGKYTVKEVSAPAGFLVDSKTYEVTLTAKNKTDEVFYEIVVSTEVPQRGVIQLQKKSSETDYGNATLKGAVYEVRNSANKVVDTLTTDAEGKANSKELPWGTYKVKETKNPYGFLIDETTHTVNLTTDNRTDRVFYKSVTSTEVPQKGVIELQKVDSETGKNEPQGAGSLKDAKYDIFLKSAYQDGDNTESKSYKGTMITDKDGKAKSKELPLETYYVKESQSSTGYLTDPQIYEVKLTADNKTEKVFVHKVKSDEDIIRGNVEIIKLMENEDEENDTLQGLKGVEFTFTSDTTGKVVKRIVTDKYGFATTADKDNPRGGLVYDTYTVTETKCPEGLKPIEPFKVTIKDEGVTLKGIYKEDKLIVSPVTVVKVDESTGKVIPIADTEFRLLDANKKPITMTTYYPNKVEHKTFKTDANGQFTFPDKLKYGTYYLEELNAPHGYLKGELLKFSVTSGSDWENPLVVKYADKNAMGKVHVLKVDDTTKKPIPAGAEFKVIAAKDIVTPDGTVRAKKGEVVDTLTTNADSSAESKDLFLGDYILKETKSVNGYLLNKEEVKFSLTYKDQDTPVVVTSKTVGNEPAMGQIVINKLDQTTEKPIPAGAEFEIRAAKDIVTPDGTVRAKKGEVVDTLTIKEKGTVTSKKLFLGQYEVQETKAPEGYILNEEIFSIELKYKDQMTPVVFETVNVKDTPAMGTVSIEKVDSKSGDALEGAIFDIRAAEDIVTPDGTVRAEKNDVVDTITTDKNGKATSDKLFLGKYIIKEVKQPQGFVLSDKEYSVELEYADQNTPVITEIITAKNKPTKLEIIKIDEQDNPLEGVSFKLWNKDMMPAENVTDKETGDDVLDHMGIFTEDEQVDSGMAVVSEYKTDAEGKITVEYLTSGTYCIEEIKADGYIVDHTVYEIVIDENGEVDGKDKGILSLKNKPNEVTIIKTDKETKEPMEGVSFKVWNKSVTEGEDSAIGVATESVTDKDGKIKLDKLVPGTYCVQEAKTLPGYVLDDTITEFTVAEDGRIDGKESIEIDRTNIFTKVDFTKHDITTGKEIEGGKYRVEDKEGNVIDSWEGTGKAHRIDKLIVGETYCFVEELAPNGYLLAQKVEFTVEKTGEVQKVEMYDEIAMGKIRIEKKDSETKELLNGAEFTITAAEDITTPDGTVRVEKGKVVDTLTTRDGVAESKELFLGKYTVKETKQPDGYILSEADWDVELKYADQDTKVVTETLEILNQPTEIEIVKTDEEKKPIAGVTFKIWNKAMAPTGDEENTNTAASVISEYETDKDGKINLQRLIPGTYCIQEAKADGYILDKNVYEIVIDKDGKVDGKEKGMLSLTNKVNEVTILKTDKETKEPMEGVVFKIWAKETQKDENNSKSPDGVEFTTDEHGKITVTKFIPGTYCVQEVKTLPGYVLDDTITEFTVAADGLIEGKESYTVERTNDFTKVLISKTDVTGDKELPGAKLQVIEKESGEVIEEWTSTEEAHLIERMKPGMYILHEEIAPDGYKVANDIEFEVKETAEIQKVTMVDEIDDNPPTIKTGDDMNMMLWILLALFACGTAITVIGMRMRDNDSKKEK